MKTRRTAIVLAVAASVAIVATGCSSGGSNSTSSSSVKFSTKVSGSITTNGFTPGDEVATSRESYAAKQLPGVTININKGQFDPQKFAAQAASGQVPDIVDMDRQDIATYAAKGLIMPLNECFATQKVQPTTHWYPAVMDSVKYKGDYYGVPQFWQTSAIMLNMRVLDKAGVTAADFNTSKPADVLAAVKKLTVLSSDGTPTLLGLDPNMPGNASSWFLTFGGQITDSAGKPTLNNANNIKALTWLKEIFDAEGGYDKATSFKNTFDYFGNDNQFATDQVAAEFNQQWYPNVLTGNTKGVDISAVPLENPSGQPIGMADGDAFAIPTNAKNPSAACAWAVAMTSDNAWVAAAKARLATVAKTPGSIFTGLFTGSKTADDIINSQYLKPSGNAGFDATIQAYNDSLKNGVNLGSSPDGLDINTELQNAIVPALEGNKPIKEALDDAQAAALSDYQQAIK
jgi:multiple sugar transport system substrate-binding protein